MSKKILVGGGVALVALVVALTSMLLFAKVQPTEAEVRAAVQSALPEGAVIDQMSFAVFSDDRSKGRVSVKGTYSFGDDIFSLPTPPLKLMELLTPLQVFDGDVATWWSENSSFYPQFNGKLGEFRKIYSAGQIIDYAGELPYLAIVDGTKIDNSSLEFKRFDGAIKPEFGYLDDTLQVIELRKAVVEWRDRRRDEAAAAEAERVAKAEAAAAVATKQAEERAAAAAKAAQADAEARARAAELEAEAAVRAAAAEAAAEAAAQAERERLEAIRTDAPAVPCQRRYTDQLNCVTVTFGYKTKYDRVSLKDHCIVVDPTDALTRTDLGGEQYRWEGADGLVAQFFDLPLGSSIGSITCGG